jgi:hypothetical protein
VPSATEDRRNDNDPLALSNVRMSLVIRHRTFPRSTENAKFAWSGVSDPS